MEKLITAAIVDEYEETVGLFWSFEKCIYFMEDNAEGREYVFRGVFDGQVVFQERPAQ